MRKPKQAEEERKAKKKVYAKTYNKKHPNRVRASAAAYRLAHKEEIKKRVYKWRREHPAAVKAIAENYEQKNPDRAKAKMAVYRKNNPNYDAESRAKSPEASKIRCHNYRAKKKFNGGKLSPSLTLRLLAFQKNRCAICRASLKKTGHHLDHIIPLARGGKNIDSNMQVTCPKCNQGKSTKDPIAFMQSRGLLL
jgi:5-methylcytosine-specific restriction endonuclease McrA